MLPSPPVGGFGQPGAVPARRRGPQGPRRHGRRVPGRAAGRALFVLSLKAGGTGLNLTAANHVIHFDRWWNPAVENQATDRAFRIGQRRTVQVHKLVCAGTLEERIDAMIEQKKALAEAVVGSGEALADRAVHRRAARPRRADPRRGRRVGGRDMSGTARRDLDAWHRWRHGRGVRRMARHDDGSTTGHPTTGPTTATRPDGSAPGTRTATRPGNDRRPPQPRRGGGRADGAGSRPPSPGCPPTASRPAAGAATSPRPGGRAAS